MSGEKTTTATKMECVSSFVFQANFPYGRKLRRYLTAEAKTLRSTDTELVVALVSLEEHSLWLPGTV